MIRIIPVGLRLTVAGVLTLAGVAVAGPALAAGSTANAQDKAWLVAAHQSNLAEIAAGKDAQAKATTSGVKDLGAMFITDHTKLDKTVVALAKKYDVTLPSGPSSAQKAALAAVDQHSGKAYDKAWVSSETTGHLQTKAGGSKELAAGNASDVLAADKTAAPVVAKHISELASLSSQLGVPSSVDAGTGGQAAVGPDRVLVTSLAGLGSVSLVAAGFAVRRRRVTVG